MHFSLIVVCKLILSLNLLFLSNRISWYRSLSVNSIKQNQFDANKRLFGCCQHHSHLRSLFAEAVVHSASSTSNLSRASMLSTSPMAFGQGRTEYGKGGTMSCSTCRSVLRSDGAEKYQQCREYLKP